VDRHRVDADPDLDPTIHFDADPDPNPDRTPSFKHVGSQNFFFTFMHSSVSLLCFIFFQRRRYQYFGHYI
jgi:hypothetical protein